MSDYDFNSTGCLERIKEIIKDFPSGMTPRMLKSILKVSYVDEILLSMVCPLTNNMIKCLEYTWKEFDIPSKMMHLKQLAENSPQEEAWRPTTGQANSNSIIAEALLTRKAGLERLIALKKAEREEIVKLIQEQYETVHQQLNNIDKCGRENNTTELKESESPELSL